MLAFMDQVSSVKYCSSCEAVFHSTRHLGQAYAHHKDSEALDQSARNGCQFCSFLCCILTETERERMRQHADRPMTATLERAGAIHSDPLTSYTISAGKEGYNMQYTFLAKRSKEDLDRYSILKNIAFLPEKSVAHIIPKKGTILASDVASTAALVSRWIKYCKESHKECNRSIGKQNFLPTRLIDVGDDDGVKPRLHITDGSSGIDEDVLYMTLSHCWGSIRIIMLETHNIEAMKDGIELSTLPKTFQDAIHITRALGIRYIWIDSLCIIQDSQEDWLRESSLMGDIYSNSYCNIAATAAKDGSVGCIHERNPIIAHPLHVQTAWIKDQPARYCLVDCDMWSREVDDAPLNQRAWVFQERFLSPRNLSFGANRLFWECAHLRACETFPGRLPRLIKNATYKVSSPAALDSLYRLNPKERNRKHIEKEAAQRLWLFQLTGALVNPSRNGGFADGQNGVPNAYRQWATIVTHYSEGLLTKESDRLIALYGVAQYFRHLVIPDDEYIAGLWKAHLLNQLLWMTYPNLKKRRPDEYRSPSWSWASVIGKVSFRDILEAEEHEKIARIVEVKVDTAKGKEGQITSGSLKIYSKVLEGTWKGNKELDGFKSSDPVATANKSADLWDLGWTGGPFPRYELNLEANRRSSFQGYPDVEFDGFQEGATLCVAIQKLDTQGKGATGQCTVEGLVLKEENNNVFKRIGWFTATDADGKYFIEKSTEREVEII